MTADYSEVSVDLTADHINVAVDPDAMADPPLEILLANHAPRGHSKPANHTEFTAGSMRASDAK